MNKKAERELNKRIKDLEFVTRALEISMMEVVGLNISEDKNSFSIDSKISELRELNRASKKEVLENELLKSKILKMDLEYNNRKQASYEKWREDTKKDLPIVEHRTTKLTVTEELIRFIKNTHEVSLNMDAHILRDVISRMNKMVTVEKEKTNRITNEQFKENQRKLSEKYPMKAGQKVRSKATGKEYIIDEIHTNGVKVYLKKSCPDDERLFSFVDELELVETKKEKTNEELAEEYVSKTDTPRVICNLVVNGNMDTGNSRVIKTIIHKAYIDGLNSRDSKK